MNWITAIGVNFVVPLIGVAAYILFCRNMQRAHLQAPPIYSYFILFAVFGGWLIVVLTVLFWQWSGMASLGVLGLVLAAPFVTAGVALSLHKRRAISGFHRGAYIASIAYSGLILALVLGWCGVQFSGLFFKLSHYPVTQRDRDLVRRLVGSVWARL